MIKRIRMKCRRSRNRHPGNQEIVVIHLDATTTGMLNSIVTNRTNVGLTFLCWQDFQFQIIIMVGNSTQQTQQTKQKQKQNI